MVTTQRRISLGLLALAVLAALLSASPATARPEPRTCNEWLISGGDAVITGPTGDPIEAIGSEWRAGSYSLDGRYLAAFGHTNGIRDRVNIRQASGATVVIGTEQMGDEEARALRWTYAKDRILIRTLSETWIFQTDGTFVEMIESNVVDLSADGTTVAYVGPDRGLWTQDLATGATANLTGPVEVTGTFGQAFIDGIRWSPSGDWIAYWLGNQGDSTDDATRVIRPDGSEDIELGKSRRILDGLGHTATWLGLSGQLAWREVTAVAEGPRGVGDLLVGVPGGTPTRFTRPSPSGSVQLLAASSDGSLIALWEVDDLGAGQSTIRDTQSGAVLYTVPTYVSYLSSDGAALVSRSDGWTLFGPDGIVGFGEGKARPRPCPGFFDVSPTSFARLDIALINELGVTQGTGPLTYSPGDPVTREQMAAFLARLWEALGNTCGGTLGEFGDVPSSSFAYSAVACLKDIGVTSGVSADRYAPGDQVTREQMAAFIARFWRAA